MECLSGAGDRTPLHAAVQRTDQWYADTRLINEEIVLPHTNQRDALDAQLHSTLVQAAATHLHAQLSAKTGKREVLEDISNTELLTRLKNAAAQPASLRHSSLEAQALLKASLSNRDKVRIAVCPCG